MNEPADGTAPLSSQTQQSLMILVERVVRPIRAVKLTKRRMREELLSHVTEIYEDELSQAGDESRAWQNAATRFGNPAGLTRELQGTVGRSERFSAILERWSELDQPGSFRLLLWRYLTVLCPVFVCYLVGISIVLPFKAAQGKPLDPIFTVRVIVTMSVIMAAFGLSAAVWADRIGHALSDTTDPQRWRKALAWIAVSIIALPTFVFVAYWGMSGEFREMLRLMKFACLLAIAVPLALLLFARHMGEERRYRDQWAHLKIDE